MCRTFSLILVSGLSISTSKTDSTHNFLPRGDIAMSGIENPDRNMRSKMFKTVMLKSAHEEVREVNKLRSADHHHDLLIVIMTSRS